MLNFCFNFSTFKDVHTFSSVAPVFVAITRAEMNQTHQRAAGSRHFSAVFHV